MILLYENLIQQFVNGSAEINWLSPQSHNLRRCYPLTMRGRTIDLISGRLATENNITARSISGKTHEHDQYRGLAYAPDFNGSSSYMAVPGLEIGNSSSHTIIGTAYRDATGVGHYLYGDSVSAASVYQFALVFVSSGDKLSYQHRNNAASHSVVGATTIGANDWFSFAASRTSDTTMIVYVNGSQDAIITTATSGSKFSPTDTEIGALDLGIGSRTGWMNGSMLDVRVYRPALSPAMIRDIYEKPWELYKDNRRRSFGWPSEVEPGGQPTMRRWQNIPHMGGQRRFSSGGF